MPKSEKRGGPLGTNAVLYDFLKLFWRHFHPTIHHLAHTKNTVFSHVFSCFRRLMGANTVEKSMTNQLRNRCGNLYRRKCEKCARSSIYSCFIGSKKLYLWRGPWARSAGRGRGSCSRRLQARCLLQENHILQTTIRQTIKDKALKPRLPT